MSRLSSWQAFDALLRGRVSAEERVHLLALWLRIQLVAAALFGLSLGVYSLTSRPDHDVRFVFSSAVKMPMLLLLTALITCPSLYVFGALRGLRFTAKQFVAMLLAGHTIFAGVLASFATVLAFFGLTTQSYSFMVLLTVGTCALAGFLGLVAFVSALRDGRKVDLTTTDGETDEMASSAQAASSEDDGFRRATDTGATDTVPGDDLELAPGVGGPASDALRDQRLFRPRAEQNTVWQVLGWWLVLYGFVGIQMGWILRPFIGAPDLEWTFLRGRSGGFLEAVFQHLEKMFTG